MASDTRAVQDLRIDKSAKEPGRVPAGVIVAILGIAAIVAAGWYFWGRAPSAITVSVVTVQAASSGQAGGAVLNASGYVTARRRATVSSKVTGRVIDVLVEEGKPVRKGQVLARLDRATSDRTLALAEAELLATRRAVAENRVRLEQARITLKRTQQLRADGIINQADLDAALTEVNALDARLALSEEQVKVSERQVALRENDVADTVIVAPFDGVAISKDAQPGEMISPVSAGGGFTRTGICTIVDMTSLEIEVDVNESYIHRVTPAQRVEATLDAYPDWKIPAKVITMVPTADRQKATVLVRIAFDKLDPRLLPDMGVKVAFLGNDSPAVSPAAPAASPTLPKAVVRTDQGSTVVFVMKDEGHVERRAVRTGRTKDDSIEIVSGVTVGDRVVTASAAPLVDGAHVIVK
jgi:RND family efflux transporter MFP subunit